VTNLEIYSLLRGFGFDTAVKIVTGSVTIEGGRDVRQWAPAVSDRKRGRGERGCPLAVLGRPTRARSREGKR
jgi:hypothetical protein